MCSLWLSKYRVLFSQNKKRQNRPEKNGKLLLALCSLLTTLSCLHHIILWLCENALLLLFGHQAASLHFMRSCLFLHISPILAEQMQSHAPQIKLWAAVFMTYTLWRGALSRADLPWCSGASNKSKPGLPRGRSPATSLRQHFKNLQHWFFGQHDGVVRKVPGFKSLLHFPLALCLFWDIEPLL